MAFLIAFSSPSTTSAQSFLVIPGPIASATCPTRSALVMVPPLPVGLLSRSHGLDGATLLSTLERRTSGAAPQPIAPAVPPAGPAHSRRTDPAEYQDRKS